MAIVTNTSSSNIVTEYQVTNFYLGFNTTLNGTPNPLVTTSVNLNYERKDYVEDSSGNKTGLITTQPVPGQPDMYHFNIGLNLTDLDTHVYDQTKTFSENLMAALDEQMSKDLTNRKLI